MEEPAHEKLTTRFGGGGLTFNQPEHQTEYDFTEDELHWDYPDDVENCTEES